MSQPPDYSPHAGQETPPPSAPQYEAPPPHAPRYEAPPAHAPRYAPPAPQQAWQPYVTQPPGPGGLFDGTTHEGEPGRPLYGANFGQAFTRFFRNYATFSGRASRSEFWWMVLAYWGAIFALSITAAIATEATSSGPARGLGEGIAALFGLVLLAVLLGSIVPWLAISWRRLHDANLPGPLWFINLAPYLGSLALLILFILPPKPEGRRFDSFTR